MTDRDPQERLIGIVGMRTAAELSVPMMWFGVPLGANSPAHNEK